MASAQSLDPAPTHAVRLIPQVGLYRIEDRDCVDAAQSTDLGRCARADHDAEHDIILLYELGSVNGRARSRETGFVVTGAAIPHDSALTSLGAELHVSARLSLLAKFDGEFAGGAQTYAGSGTLRYAW